jgi:hypothetical protein
MTEYKFHHVAAAMANPWTDDCNCFSFYVYRLTDLLRADHHSINIV